MHFGARAVVLLDARRDGEDDPAAVRRDLRAADRLNAVVVLDRERSAAFAARSGLDVRPRRRELRRSHV